MKKTYVLGDVHGCYHTLLKLIKKLEKNSTMIFVGDLVDKGNFSKQVVQYVIDNHHSCILGNHEYLMLKHIKEAILEGNISEWSSKKSFGGYKSIQNYQDDMKTLDKHLSWIKTLPQYIIKDKFFITHGFGLPYYKRKDELTSKIALMSNRLSEKENWSWDWEREYEKYDIVNIYGHEVVEKIDITKNYIGIDTGCVYGERLSAIELDSKEIIFEPVDKRDITKV